MRSRFLALAVAWITGLAIATTGSLIAVNALAHGLLRPPVQQPVAATALQDDPTPSPQPSPLPTRQAAAPVTSSPPVTSMAPVTGTAHVTSAPPVSNGTLLTSPDGNVMASCQPGGAYLQYWIPAQGFSADDVIRGPAATARITFEQLTTELTMTVSCSSGRPVAHVTAG